MTPKKKENNFNAFISTVFFVVLSSLIFHLGQLVWGAGITGIRALCSTSPADIEWLAVFLVNFPCVFLCYFFFNANIGWGSIVFSTCIQCHHWPAIAFCTLSLTQVCCPYLSLSGWEICTLQTILTSPDPAWIYPTIYSQALDPLREFQIDGSVLSSPVVHGSSSKFRQIPVCRGDPRWKIQGWRHGHLLEDSCVGTWPLAGRFKYGDMTTRWKIPVCIHHHLLEDSSVKTWPHAGF